MAVSAVVLCGALVLFFINNAANTSGKDRMLPITMNAIQTAGGGWGYEIFVDGKIFIKQENVPAVSGYRSFESKEQALAVGNLAVKKLVKGQLPSITKTELKSLGVAIE